MSKLIILIASYATLGSCTQETRTASATECEAYAKKVIEKIYGQSFIFSKTISYDNSAHVVFLNPKNKDDVSVTFYGPSLQYFHIYSSRMYRLERDTFTDGRVIVANESQARTRTASLIQALSFSYPLTIEDIKLGTATREDSGKYRFSQVEAIGRPYVKSLPLFSPHGIKVRIDPRDGFLLSAAVRMDALPKVIGADRMGKAGALAKVRRSRSAVLGYRVGADQAGHLVWRIETLDGKVVFVDAESGRFLL